MRGVRTPRDLDRAAERRFPWLFGWESRSLSWHAGYVLWVLGVGGALSLALSVLAGPDTAWSVAIATCWGALGAQLQLWRRLRR